MRKDLRIIMLSKLRLFQEPVDMMLPNSVNNGQERWSNTEPYLKFFFECGYISSKDV